jgi:tetratricopeptide (TPR) repeat protein
MRKIILYSLILFSCFVSAQEKDQEEKKKEEKDKELPKGNKAFAEKKYTDAEANYRVSRSKNPEKAAASYNLGNSIYKQKQIAESKAPYLKAIEKAKTHLEKHRAYHNLGNVYMSDKKYQQAVEAYKNALRSNPADEETRYNYALAKKFLKDNPPPKNKKDDKKDKKDDKKDQKQDKKEDKKDENKDKGDDKQNKPDQPKDNGQPKPTPGGISKERLQSMLEAVNNEEKKVQQKVNAHKVKGKPIDAEKDW